MSPLIPLPKKRIQRKRCNANSFLKIFFKKFLRTQLSVYNTSCSQLLIFFLFFRFDSLRNYDIQLNAWSLQGSLLLTLVFRHTKHKNMPGIWTLAKAWLLRSVPSTLFYANNLSPFCLVLNPDHNELIFGRVILNRVHGVNCQALRAVVPRQPPRPVLNEPWQQPFQLWINGFWRTMWLRNIVDWEYFALRGSHLIIIPKRRQRASECNKASQLPSAHGFCHSGDVHDPRFSIWCHALLLFRDIFHKWIITHGLSSTLIKSKTSFPI